MPKRPTPKKRLPKNRSRRRHSVFQASEVLRLRNKSVSPYAAPATKKERGDKALEKITKIKA